MSQLNVDNISIQYQQHDAVESVSFRLAQGEVGCLLGPSGCGKTSILRAIAGFEPITTGEIVLAQRQVASVATSLPPQQRNIGMVFQDFALYPHLTVADNVGFGLNDRPKTQAQQRVDALLDLVDMQAFKHRYPHELSGGQQQRVALIRAIAPAPALLLMDEPFSNMDVTLKQSLAMDIRQILKQAGVTTILVTHDQTEAFAMADQISVLHEGKLMQTGTAAMLYQMPSSRFVAEFIGSSSFIPAKRINANTVQTLLGDLSISHHIQDNRALQVHIRPEMLAIDAQSKLQATVTKRLFLGAHMLYTLQLDKVTEVMCLANNQSLLAVGDSVGVRLIPQSHQLFGQG